MGKTAAKRGRGGGWGGASPGGGRGVSRPFLVLSVQPLPRNRQLSACNEPGPPSSNCSRPIKLQVIIPAGHTPPSSLIPPPELTFSLVDDAGNPRRGGGGFLGVADPDF